MRAPIRRRPRPCRGLEPELRPAARTALAGFVAVIEKYRALVNDMAVDEMIRELVMDINYAQHLRSEGEDVARERLENVRALRVSERRRSGDR